MIFQLSRASFESRRRSPHFEPDFGHFFTGAGSFSAQTGNFVANSVPKPAHGGLSLCVIQMTHLPRHRGGKNHLWIACVDGFGEKLAFGLKY
jgi:hypothetical protein